MSGTTMFPVEHMIRRKNSVLSSETRGFVCLVCGQTEDPPAVPLPVGEWLAICNRFIDRHCACHLTEPEKAISLRQPWAWLMIHGPKDIENRLWNTHFRGRVLVHAAKGMTRKEYWEVQRFAAERGVTIPAFEDLQRGGIIGEFTITDCVTSHDSPWFMGPFGFTTVGRKPLPFRPCVGMLGFFKPKLAA